LIETSDTPAYASARRFYETCGYRCEAIVHDFYAPGNNLLIFAKNLLADAHSGDIGKPGQRETTQHPIPAIETSGTANR
jgi:hypothetical protein